LSVTLGGSCTTFFTVLLLRSNILGWFLLTLGLAWSHVFCRAAEVEVAAVRFAPARPASNPSVPWLEATVGLNVVPPPDAPGRMVSRVRVQLWVGVETLALTGSTARTEYYRAEVECLALPAGRSEVRFYFPPEWVKRDQLPGAPRHWAVELAVAGRAVAPVRAASATALGEAAARRAFLVAALAGAPANDGWLQPQYFTPFAQEYPRSTVTFVRREPSLAPPARASP
jgi:hypothetical protein